MLKNDISEYPKQRESINVENYINLVKKIAMHIKGRLPPNVLLDDLIQSGMVGLLEAKKKFDASKGASFETYAGIRIRGAIIDEMRRGDWVPRSVHKNSRRVTESIDILERKLKRPPKDIEIANELNISIEEYNKILLDINNGKIVEVDKTSNVLDAFGTNPNNNKLFDTLKLEKLKVKLADHIKKLPQKEAFVLSLYYEKELNLSEIGSILDVSESRVCQIHSQAISRLKVKIKEWS